MKDVNTIHETVKRAALEGLPVSEYTLRMWVKRGAIPVRKAGRTALIYWPNLRDYLTCADGKGDIDKIPDNPDISASF